MKFKLTTKIKTVVVTTMCSAILLSPVVVVPIANALYQQTKAASDEQYYYLYNGEYYDSLEEATQKTIVNKKPISSDIYVGDITDAVFDQEAKRVDILRLRKHDVNKLYPAFKNAIAEYSPSYEEARDSFVNPGLIDYLYDDFKGNLYSEESDAVKSMMDATFRTPLGYHELNLSATQDPVNNFLINPLNKDDIEVLKEKVLENLQTSEKLDIKAYDIIDDPLRSDGVAYASVTSSFLNQNSDYINYLLNTVVPKAYIDTKNEFFENQVKWDVTVTAVKENNDINYKFENVRYQPRPDCIKLGHNHSVNNSVLDLYFRNASTAELASFKRFLSWEGFHQDHNLWIRNGFMTKIAEEASSKNNLVGANYSIIYNGGRLGESPDVDIRILTPGSFEMSEQAFNVQIKMVNPVATRNTFRAALNKKFNAEFIKQQITSNSLFIQNSQSLSFSYDLYNNIINQLVSNVFNAESGVIFNSNRALTKNKKHDGTLITNMSLGNDLFWKVVSESKEVWTPGTGATFAFNEHLSSDFIQYILNLNLSFWSKHLKYIIEYNGNPLFEIPNEIFEKKINQTGLLKPNNTAQTLYKESFNPYGFKSITFDELKDSLINVSSRYKTSEYSNNDGLVKYDYLPFNYDLKSYTYTKYEQDSKGLFKYEQVSPFPSIEMKDLGYKMDIAMFTYNNSLQNIYNKQSFLPETTKNLMIKPEEVLTLNTNLNQNGEKIYYSEYLTSTNSFNNSLLAQSNTTLYNSETGITNAIESVKLLKPAKIVVLYDLLGKVLNAGVRLSNDDKLLTTNDAVYDTRNAVLDNVLRTKVIRNNPNKTFYLEANGNYTLLENTKDLVYQLDWETKTYHFPTFQDAQNYVYEFIKRAAIRVAK